VSEKIFTVKVKTGKSHCCIIGAYAPVEEKTEEIENIHKAGGK
jgi:hypothetical protein